MSSTSKADANRRNAARSTGPRTSAGKARASQNARRHGLNSSAIADQSLGARITEIAQALAVEGATVADATWFAMAYVDLERVTAAKRDRLAREVRPHLSDVARTEAGQNYLATALLPTVLDELATLDGYERKFWSRMRKARAAVFNAKGR